MAAFTWSNELVTGNTMIDTQHQQLFKSINELLEACSGGHGKEQVASTMQFLIDYTAKHFGDEEKLQQQHSYPDYPNHKKLHETFKASIAEMAKQLQTEGATVVLLTKLSSGTGGWLINHIHREDKRVATHIHSH